MQSPILHLRRIVCGELGGKGHHTTRVLMEIRLPVVPLQ